MWPGAGDLIVHVGPWVGAFGFNVRAVVSFAAAVSSVTQCSLRAHCVTAAAKETKNAGVWKTMSCHAASKSAAKSFYGSFVTCFLNEWCYAFSYRIRRPSLHFPQKPCIFCAGAPCFPAWSPEQNFVLKPWSLKKAQAQCSI